MKASNYQCVNCQILFQVEAQYIEHYKSEHHRYNVKRKIIGLPPLSSQEYHLRIESINIEFQDEKTSKQSVDQQFYCEICSKKFMNSGTYKQHISSKKHKLNRAQLKVPQKFTMSKSSSESEFQIIGTEKPETCFFCNSEGSSHHMKTQHSFPPFEAECINYNGLVEYVRAKVGKLCCVYCDTKFNSEESVKQHMNDVGHAKLNIERFNQYEKFYLWKILQSSSESDQQLSQQKTVSPTKSQQSQSFINLEPPTLQELEQRRLDRITYTPTGAIINGKQVGYRHLRVYYKQYLNREIINLHPNNQVAIEGQIKHDWKSGAKAIQKVPKINTIVHSR